MERSELTSTKRYDRFRNEFKDVFDEMYANQEEQGRDGAAQEGLKEKFDKEKIDEFRKGAYRN